MSWSHWVRRGCALLVASVAAYASYEHQRRFALDWGAEAVSAALWPLSVDGLVVLASIGLLEVGAAASWRARWSVRAAFLLGVAVSLVANIAVAPVLIWQSIVVAGWPPVALLLAIELLTVNRHHGRPGQPQAPGSPSAGARNGHPPRVMSVRAAVQHLLENSPSPLTNSEIVAALRDDRGHFPDKRLRANVTNSLWTLRRSGLVERRDGKNAIAGQPAAHA